MPNAQLPSFGITTAPQQVSDTDIQRAWREADAIPDIEHAWLFDHLLPIGGDTSRSACRPSPTRPASRAGSPTS